MGKTPILQKTRSEPLHSASAADGYNSNVFINCPFDGKYLKLLRPLLFTVIYLGYRPRMASERSDSGESRLDKICELIRISKFSIHDLSRLKAARAQEFYRMNMPFELGIDYGSRQHGLEYMRGKKCLILEKEQHDFKKALSDLSGVDIKSHKNRPVEVVRSVRDWFYETVGCIDAPYPSEMWFLFSESFSTSLFEDRLAEGLPEPAVREDIARMSMPEYVKCVEAWKLKFSGSS